MNLNVERYEDVLFLMAKERIDGSNATVFEDTVLDSIDKTDRAVIVDFGEVPYISSAGLKAVLTIAKSLQQNRGIKLAVCRLSGQVMEVFETSGFSKLMVVRDNRAEARTAVGV